MLNSRKMASPFRKYQPHVIVPFVVCLLLAPSFGRCQYDTLNAKPFFAKNILSAARGFVRQDLIENKAFPFLYEDGGNFLSCLLYSRELVKCYNSKQNNFTIDRPLSLRNCEQYLTHSRNFHFGIENSIKYSSTKPLTFTRVKTPFPFELHNLLDDTLVELDSSRIHGVILQNCQMNFSMSSDTILNAIMLNGDDAKETGSLTFQNDVFEAQNAAISLLGATKFNGEINVTGEEFKQNLEVSFYKDTIANSVKINWKQDNERGYSLDSNSSFELSFSQCYINGSILLGNNAKNCKLSFTLCTFGPNAIINAPGDIIEFNECTRLPRVATPIAQQAISGLEAYSK
jgi:hypothetical protein